MYSNEVMWSESSRLMSLRRSVLLALLVVCARGEGAGGPRGVPCALDAPPRAPVAWLAADFAPLAADHTRWRILDNGTLLILADAAGGLPAAVRCRVTTARGSLVSAPIPLLPVWEEGAVRVSAGAVQPGGVAALRCEWPRATAGRGHTARGPVRWWRNDELLTLTTPTPSTQYVAAGEAGEWLLVDGAAPSDRFACQPPAAPRSLPARLHFTEQAPGGSARGLGGVGGAGVPAVVRALAGTALCLPCAAPDYPPPHYTWYRESGGRLQAAHEAGAWSWRGGAALCIPRAARAAAGAWLCRAASARGDATVRVALTVHAPLTLTLSPPLAVAGGGDTVRLECQTSDPEATVSWLHEGAPATLRSDVTPLGGNALLLRATPRTRGLWQCEARRLGEVELAAAELRLAEAAPELRDTFIEQALRPGARVSLRCAAAGAPPPRVSWRRDDAPLTAGPTSHRYFIGEERVGASETVSTLNISAAAAEDGGLYTCHADNPLGRTEHSARLNIYGPPLVRTTAPRRVLAGENVTLLCPYAGYPISSVTWQRGGAVLGSEGTVRARGAALELRPARAPHAGRYSCRVLAPDGAAAAADLQLLVLNPPKISPFVFSSELSAGDAVRVICSVSAGDRPLAFAWLKDGAPPPPDLQIEETSLDDFSLLKFGELTERHSGNYTCRVTNPAVSVDYTATLHVKVAPSWTREPIDTAAAAGAPLQLECAARGRPPPAVAWHRRLCDAGLECEWRPLPSNGTLRAPAATRDLAGLYRCSAENGVGPPLLKHINVSVYEAAQIESSNAVENVSCVRAQTAPCALLCAARGDEPLAVTWTRARSPLDLHSGRVSVSEARGADGARSSRLEVRAPAAADAGHYRCRANNTRGSSERLFLLHIEEPPAAPVDLRVCARDARLVRLCWRGAAGAALRYSAALEQLRAHSGAASDLHDLSVDPPSQRGCEAGRVCAPLSGLQPAGAYAARVRATSRAGQSPLSAPLLFTTLEDAPSGVPQDVHVRGGDSGELHVSWSPPARATWNGELLGYVVTWRAVAAWSDASSAARAGRAVRRGGSALVLRALRARTQYSVAVRAFNRAGVGPLSPMALAFTSDGEAEAPADVRCAGLSARELRVLWTPRAHLQYELLYAPAFTLRSVWSEEEEAAMEGWRVQRTDAGGGGEARVAGLRAGTNYSVWVRARAGPAAPPAHCATLPAAGAVSAVWARAVSADAVRVWWRPPAHGAPPTHYVLYTRDLSRPSGEWAQRVEVDETYEGISTPARVVSGLRGNARYEFWVRAHSPAGAGPPSPRVLAAPHPHASAEAARIWSFPVSLVAAAGARVRLPCAADGAPPLRWRWAPQRGSHGLAAPHLDILGVQPEWAGNYTCTVRNALGADSVTHTLRARPAPEPPPAPPPPRLARATTHQLQLTWDTIHSTFPPLIGYTLEWQVEAEGLEEAGAPAAGVAAATAEQTVCSLRALACGATHRVHMRAHNACGASPPSPPLLATTAGHAPVAAAAREFVWANSSALRLGLLQWDAPCAVAAWRVAVRAPPRAWTELRAPHPLDHVFEVGDLNAGTWYEVRVTARWAGGEVTALYRAATLSVEGERIGESEQLPAGARAAGGEGGPVLALSAAVLPGGLALLAAAVSLLMWCLLRSGGCTGCGACAGRCGGRHAPVHSLRPQDELPPPPLCTLDYTLPTKCDIADIRVMSARLSSADSASDSSAGEPCAACQRAAHAQHHPAHAQHHARRAPRARGVSPPPAPAPARPYFSST